MTDEKPQIDGPQTDDPQSGLTDDFDTEIDTDVEADEAEDTVAASETGASARTPRRRVDSQRIVAFGVLPAMTLGLAVGAGLLLWKHVAQDAVDTARTESVSAAREATVAILSYRADTVEADRFAAVATRRVDTDTAHGGRTQVRRVLHAVTVVVGLAAHAIDTDAGGGVEAGIQVVGLGLAACDPVNDGIGG